MGCRESRHPITVDQKELSMKRNDNFTLSSLTEIKIFLTYILDYIDRPLDYTTLSRIIMDNVENPSLDYEEALNALSDDGYLYFDEIDGERYYMITEIGRSLASELYDTLDADIREKSIRVAVKHISFVENGTRTNTKIEEADNKRFKVTVEAHSRLGKIMSVSMLVPSRSEAEEIAARYEDKPDAVYRGVMFALTGRLELID